MIDFEFTTVRGLCRACGWSRAIGVTGIKNGTRAVISVRSCNEDCNVISARTRFYPATVPLAEIQVRCPSYRDLQEEACEIGLVRMCDGFSSLFCGRRCPRCRAVGELRLDAITLLGREPRY